MVIDDGMFRAALAQLGNECGRLRLKWETAKAAHAATAVKIEECEQGDGYGRIGGGRSHFWANDTARVAKSKALREQLKSDAALIDECWQTYEKSCQVLTDYAHPHLIEHDATYANIVALIGEIENVLAAAHQVNTEIMRAGSRVGNAKIGEAADFLIAGGPLGLGIAIASWYLTRNAGKLENLTSAMRRFEAVSKQYDRRVALTRVEAPYLGIINNVGLAADIFDFGGGLLNVANYYQLHGLGNKIGTLKEQFARIESAVEQELKRVRRSRIKYINNLVVDCMKSYKSPA